MHGAHERKICHDERLALGRRRRREEKHFGVFCNAVDIQHRVYGAERFGRRPVGVRHRHLSLLGGIEPPYSGNDAQERKPDDGFDIVGALCPVVHKRHYESHHYAAGQRAQYAEGDVHRNVRADGTDARGGLVDYIGPR